MASKEKVLVNLNKNNYPKHEVVGIINSITHIESDLKKQEERKPSYIKKGDCFILEDANGKNRPHVVAKVLKDTVIAIPLSTTQDCLCLMPFKSRFLKEGYFSKQFLTLQKGIVEKRWAGVFDNEKALRKAIRELKNYLNNTI